MEALAADDPRWVGRYRVLAALGTGGMGRVLLATSPDGRPAAVKYVHAFLARDPVFRERFRREIAAGRLVSGAYTAPILDADPEADIPWLATLYVPGPSLRHAVETTGPLPPLSVRWLAGGLATALADIHRVGLVHRDLKPSNILLTHDGPRVIDFGIARAAEDDPDLMRADSVLGSPEFMSPEQAEGRALTAASDVFSLGSLLTLAALGRAPFTGASAAQTLYNVVHTHPDLTALPGWARELVEACLAKDPADRPTAEQVLDRLDELGDVPPGTAPWPPGIHGLVREQEARARAALAAPPAADAARHTRSGGRRATAVRVTSAGAVAVSAAVAVFVALGHEPDVRAGAASATGTSPPPRTTTTGADPGDTGPFGPDGLRAVDPCRVLADDLDPVIDVHLSACTYETGEGQWVELTLGDAVPTSPEPDAGTGSTEVAGLPLVVDKTGAHRCVAVAVLPDPPDTGIGVTVGPGSGQVRDDTPCVSAEDRLSTAVERLRVGGLDRAAVPGSLATVDPCGLLDHRELREIFGVVSTSEPDGLHRCTWRVTGSVQVALERATRPERVDDGAGTTELGDVTASVRPYPDEGSPGCAVSWTHLASDESLDEVVTVHYRATASGLPVDEVCADTRTVAETIIPRLPTP